MHFPGLCEPYPNIPRNVSSGLGKRDKPAQKGTPGNVDRSHSLFPVSPQLSDKQDCWELRYSLLLLLFPKKDV